MQAPYPARTYQFTGKTMENHDKYARFHRGLLALIGTKMQFTDKIITSYAQDGFDWQGTRPKPAITLLNRMLKTGLIVHVGYVVT